MINWLAVTTAGIIEGAFALVLPLWAAIPAGVALGLTLIYTWPKTGRHRRTRR